MKHFYVYKSCEMVTRPRRNYNNNKSFRTDSDILALVTTLFGLYSGELS